MHNLALKNDDPNDLRCTNDETVYRGLQTYLISETPLHLKNNLCYLGGCDRHTRVMLDEGFSECSGFRRVHQ